MTPPAVRTRRIRLLPAIILVVGLAVFAGFSVACLVVFHQSENRLLQQQTNEAGAVLEVSVSQVRSPLDAAAKLADVTDGDQRAFAQVLAPYIGDGLSFSSAALFRFGDPAAVAAIGSPSLAGTGEVQEMLASVATTPFVIVDLLRSGRRLGYAVADNTKQPTWVVYGERTLSANPNVRRRTEQPFAQLNYAIYLGSVPDAAHLLGASLQTLPITGRSASTTVPFGDTKLMLVTSPIGRLSGSLFADLWWIVAAIGTLVSVAVAALTGRLLQRRDIAVSLAVDNERLYDEQRTIAETLQIGLLPQHLEIPPGDEITARYWPAGEAGLIGGDFYDAFRVGPFRWAVTIGDVCGKGVEAAALTGLVRHTIRAVATVDNSPSDVLCSVDLAVKRHEPTTFCTACLLYIDVGADGRRQVTMSLGGHPRPVFRRRNGTVEHPGTPGTLLGIVTPSLTDTVLDVGAGDTLMLYTDGLTDAPADEAVPIAEIEALLGQDSQPQLGEVAESLRELKRRRRPKGSGDDTVILIIRFATGDCERETASTGAESAVTDEFSQR